MQGLTEYEVIREKMGLTQTVLDRMEETCLNGMDM